MNTALSVNQAPAMVNRCPFPLLALDRRGPVVRCNGALALSQACAEHSKQSLAL